MINRYGIMTISALPVVAANIHAQKVPDEKPNILLITTDYQAGLDVPWETPGLDMPVLAGLAADGIVFNKHYCTAPISMPARYTLITGMYPHYHGEWDNQAVWVPEGTPILMELLRESGYLTSAVGKMHFHPWDRDAGFDTWISAERKGNSAADTVRKDDYARFLAGAGLSRASYLNMQGSSEIYGVYDWPYDDSLHIDHFVGEEATGLANRNNDPPWFMWVSFNGPHNPWDPPARYSQPYMQKEMPEPVWKEGILSNQPYDYTDLRYNYTRRIVDLIDENPDKRDYYIKRIRAGHYGGLTFIDEQIGKIISALRETGQLENTIIIFTADHGASLGDHDLIHKGTHLERSARVPMVVWFGSNHTKGTISDYSAHVDIMPTILDMAGAPIPESLEGTSLLPVIAGEKAGADHAIIEIRRNYSRISDEYIFGVFPSTNEEVLVDRINDPFETINLAYEDSKKELADSLRNLLFSFHPAIRDEVKAGIKANPLPLSLELGHGEQSIPAKTPFIGGKGFRLVVNCESDKDISGTLVTFYQGNLHGFELKSDEDGLLIGFRSFGKERIFRVDSRLKAGTNKIVLDISESGRMHVKVNNRLRKRFKTPWPMPVQPGAERYFTGLWFSGKTAPPRFLPIINNTIDDGLSLTRVWMNLKVN